MAARLVATGALIAIVVSVGGTLPMWSGWRAVTSAVVGTLVDCIGTLGAAWASKWRPQWLFAHVMWSLGTYVYAIAAAWMHSISASGLQVASRSVVVIGLMLLDHASSRPSLPPLPLLLWIVACAVTPTDMIQTGLEGGLAASPWWWASSSYSWVRESEDATARYQAASRAGLSPPVWDLRTLRPLSRVRSTTSLCGSCAIHAVVGIIADDLAWLGGASVDYILKCGGEAIARGACDGGWYLHDVIEAVRYAGVVPDASWPSLDPHDHPPYRDDASLRLHAYGVGRWVAVGAWLIAATLLALKRQSTHWGVRACIASLTAIALTSGALMWSEAWGPPLMAPLSLAVPANCTTPPTTHFLPTLYKNRLTSTAAARAALLESKRGLLITFPIYASFQRDQDRVAIYNGPQSSNDIRMSYHAAVVVGWGQGYWIARNSWGRDRGMRWDPGYIYIGWDLPESELYELRGF